MTPEDRQAQLLDDYLTALQRNLQATIPDGLDPDMAQFARMLLNDGGNSRASQAQASVWQKLKNTDELSHSKRTQDNYRGRKRYMNELKKKNDDKHNSWLPLVATVIISVVATLGLVTVFLNFNNDRANLMFRVDETELTAQSQFVTATSIPNEAQLTEFVISSTPTPTPMLPTVPPPVSPTFTPTPLPTLTHTPAALSSTEPVPTARQECNFEDDLLLVISDIAIDNDDLLFVSGTARNDRTEELIIEIFGGFATNDEYQPIDGLANPTLDDPFIVQIAGADYPAGDYLVNLRLIDADDETVASCALSVTFTGN